MKKDKELVMENPSRNEEEEDDDYDNQRAAAFPSSTRNASSKYDFVKVRISGNLLPFSVIP